MSGWIEFATAFAVFLASHAIPALPGVRARLVGALGRRGYLAGYVAVSLLALGWLIAAAGRAPYAPVWPRDLWMLLVPHIAMALACPLIAFGVGAPNPLSFGGARNDRFDVERPGIVGLARHPLLWALALWAGAHLLVAADLAHALMFATFLAFSLAGMAVIDRRKRRALGEAAWARIAARTSAFPLAALATGRWRPAGAPSAGRTFVAAALWIALATLHSPVIGHDVLGYL